MNDAPLVFSTRDPSWLSNSYLVADRLGGHAVLIDTGGPMEPIVERIVEWRVELTHVLCTHHHPDHTLHNEDYKSSYGCPVCGHAAERDHYERIGHPIDQELRDREEVRSGDLRIRALHVPGHTSGQLSFLVNDCEVYTGDTLFKGSVGGTRGQAHTNSEDLQHSIMDVLMQLPKETVIRPGHMEATSVAEEWERNPFVRYWRGLEATGSEACEAFGVGGELLIAAADYDGGEKCLVRFDDGHLDVVPGSRVKRRSDP
ncbi:MAG: MBL fold metallo-hydrolase [Planctomycetota bacterium]